MMIQPGRFWESWPVLKLFKSNLPCCSEQYIAESEVQPCLRGMRCPVSVKLHDSLEKIKGTSYQCGYTFVAWVVLKGANCELMVFQKEPDATELKQRYGDKLNAIVPI
jgi:hypothetical protein